MEIQKGQTYTTVRDAGLSRKVLDIFATNDDRSQVVQYENQAGKIGACSAEKFRAWIKADKY